MPWSRMHGVINSAGGSNTIGPITRTRRRSLAP